MKSKIVLLFIVFIFFFLACEKEKDIPCTTFPCGSDNPDSYNYNRVAFDPQFRIGTWINVRASASSPDTIIFYNDTVWSLFNKLGGYYEGKYGFNGIYLQVKTDVNNQELIPPIEYQSYYSDSTGIFSLLIQQGINGFQQWNHYVKIE